MDFNDYFRDYTSRRGRPTKITTVQQLPSEICALELRHIEIKANLLQTGKTNFFTIAFGSGKNSIIGTFRIYAYPSNTLLLSVNKTYSKQNLVNFRKQFQIAKEILGDPFDFSSLSVHHQQGYQAQNLKEDHLWFLKKENIISSLCQFILELDQTITVSLSSRNHYRY